MQALTHWLPQLSILTLLGLTTVACTSTDQAVNRTPNTLISGLDQPHEAALGGRERPSTADDGHSIETLLDPFVSRVLAVSSGATVAVFPAFDATNGSARFSGLGEYLMEETARRLQDGGLQVMSGSQLTDEISLWNRPPELIRTAEDILQIAAWAGFDYVVFGSAGLVATDIRTNTSRIDIDWQCRDLSKQKTIAKLSKPDLGKGPFAQELARRTREKPSGSWNATGAINLSLDTEIELQCRVAVRRLYVQNETRIKRSGGKPRVSIAATVLPKTGVKTRQLQDFSKAFAEAFNQQLRAPALRETLNAEDVVMGQPCTIMGRAYPSFSDARHEFARLQSEFDASEAGQLAQLLAEKLSAAFELVAEMEIVPSTEDTLSLSRLINDQADSEFIDQGTVPFVMAKGAQFFVESRIEKDLDGKYAFTIKLTNVDGEYWSAQERVDLMDYFTSKLAARLR